MPAKAPVLDRSGKKEREIDLADGVFAADVKVHLIHEAVRAEAAAARSGTRAAKTRGEVSGGRSKPWRQKGTGRARAGTTRAPQWTGGGVAFAPQPRSHDVKVNRKARKAALRGALAHHVARGSLGILDGSAFGSDPSTKSASALVASWGAEPPVLVVAQAEEDSLVKSFRNLDRVLVVEPSELEVSALVWARSLLVSEAALARIQEVAT